MVTLWVEWRVDDGAVRQFEEIIRRVIACVEREEPGARGFWAYRGADDRTFHLLEVFEDVAAAELHLSGEIGPVSAYVPQQRAIARLERVAIHGEVSDDEAGRLRGFFGGDVYTTVAGFTR